MHRLAAYVFAAALVHGLLATASSAAVIHVPADQPTIAAALAAAGSGDEIVLAPGTYQEAFNVTKNVTLRSASGRASDTILDFLGSGRIGVLADATIADLTLTRGDAAILSQNTSMVISGCVFKNNTGTTSGAALQIQGGNPTILACTFENNSSTTGGGAVAIFAGSTATLRRCVFRNNTAPGAAGLFNIDSNPTIVDCSFFDNTTAGEAGAINNHNSTASIVRCEFVGNSAFEGAAINIAQGSAPVVRACRFRANGASQGGAVNVEDAGSSASLINCLFVDNRATTGSGLGGAIFVWSPGSVDAVNCTFHGNTSRSLGGAIYSQSSSLALTNSIFASNSPDHLANAGGTSTATHCSFVGGLPSGTIDGGGNLDADPLLLGPASGDYRLHPDSPCVDAGTQTGVTATVDIEGDGRQVDGDSDGTAATDIGADEFDLLWKVEGQPMFGGSLQFTAMYPPHRTGEIAFVAISRGDGSSGSGITIAGCPKTIGLDADATVNRWRALDRRFYRVTLSGSQQDSTDAISIPASGGGGQSLQLYHAGLSIDPNGDCVQVTPTRSLVVQ